MAATKQATVMDKILLEAVNDRDVDALRSTDWNDWQRWRKRKSKRPTRRDDGAVTDPKFEVELWQATITEIHGADWATQLLQPTATLLECAVR